MGVRRALAVLSLLVAGILIGLYFGSARADTTQEFTQPLANIITNDVIPKESPMDRIPENAILVYKDRVVLDLKNAEWATFTDTHSMEPIIAAGANAIEIIPKSVDDIKVGDIVSYKSSYAEGTIIHRVVYKGTDEQGTYFIMKGDNLPTSDPGRVRFSQMKRVVVAIIY